MKDYQIRAACEDFARRGPGWGTTVRVGDHVLVVSANAAMRRRAENPLRLEPEPRADKGEFYQTDARTGQRTIYRIH